MLPLSASLKAISTADLIVMGPGSLYTSIIPNLLVPGIVEAICASKAPKVYISNVMTQSGETDSYTAAQHLQSIIKHGGKECIDHILVHGSPISEQVKENYANEGAYPVEINKDELKQIGVTVICDQFAIEKEGKLRHDAIKVSEALLRTTERAIKQ